MALQRNGVKTGLFVSPHLASFRERMQVDGVLISENDFMMYTKYLFNLCKEHSLTATEFELAFLMAALHYRNQNCGAVVLEVGLGGEHDATNVVSTALSILCSVCKIHLFCRNYN